MEKINILIFSKDRAMQLHCLLMSLSNHCIDIDNAKTFVLYATSNKIHAKNYIKLKEDFPSVTFVVEQDFEKQTRTIITSCDFILFLVDDSIFIRAFSLSECIKTLNSSSKFIGFSLRLGLNIKHHISYGNIIRPHYKRLKTNIYSVKWPHSELDFAFPLEVSSSLYNAQLIKDCINNKSFRNPSFFEKALTENVKKYSHTLPTLTFLKYSCCFSNPANLVQDCFINLHSSSKDLQPDALAQKFAQGIYIDHKRFSGIYPCSTHKELAFDFISSETQQCDITKIGVLSTSKKQKFQSKQLLRSFNNNPALGFIVESSTRFNTNCPDDILKHLSDINCLFYRKLPFTDKSTLIHEVLFCFLKYGYIGEIVKTNNAKPKMNKACDIRYNIILQNKELFYYDDVYLAKLLSRYFTANAIVYNFLELPLKTILLTLNYLSSGLFFKLIKKIERKFIKSYEHIK